jgi:hypothetical protein
MTFLQSLQKVLKNAFIRLFKNGRMQGAQDLSRETYVERLRSQRNAAGGRF